MLYLQLFYTFFKIGLFGFGGGYAIISLIQNDVLSYGWMTPTEFVDIVAISQMTPGPIGINAATYIGYTATGTIFGSLLATTAIILPSVIVMLILCRMYMKLGDNRYVDNVLAVLRIAVIGLIAAAALSMTNSQTFIDYWSIILFAVVFIASLTQKVHPILLICLSGLAGFFIYGL